MIQVTASIHYRIIRGKVKYYLHFTFSPDCVKALKWKAKDKVLLLTQVRNTLIEFHPTSWYPQLQAGLVNNSNGPELLSYSLGKYKDREALWFQSPIVNTQRKSFLTNYSNGLATKIQWKEQGISITDGMLKLYGKGKPFRKGVSKR
jgi:hypothetical protein